MQIVKVFVLGMPGSGKSTIGRHIVERAKQQHQEWMITRFNDYHPHSAVGLTGLGKIARVESTA